MAFLLFVFGCQTCETFFQPPKNIIFRVWKKAGGGVRPSPEKEK